MLDKLGLIIAIVLFYFGFKYYLGTIKDKHKEKSRLYAEYANKHHLSISQTNHILVPIHKMNGMVDGFNISFYEEMTGHGKNQTLMTHIIFTDSTLAFKFNIGKKTFFNKDHAPKEFVAVKFDDKELDSGLFIKSETEDKLRKLLNYNLQTDLKEMSVQNQFLGTITSNSKTLKYSVIGGLMKQSDFNSFETVISFMLALMKGR